MRASWLVAKEGMPGIREGCVLLFKDLSSCFNSLTEKKKSFWGIYNKDLKKV